MLLPYGYLPHILASTLPPLYRRCLSKLSVFPGNYLYVCARQSCLCKTPGNSSVIQKRGRPLLPHSHAFDVGLRGGQPYPAAGRHGWRMEKLTLNYERLRDKGPAPRRECGRTCTCNAFCLSIDRGMTLRLLSLLPGRHPCRAVLGDRYEGFQPLNSFDLSFCVRPLQIPVYLIVPPRTHLYM